MSVSLTKGGSVSLEKNGQSLTKSTMGLGWDVAKSKGFFGGGGGSIDLDASAIVFDESKNVLDIVYFGARRSKDGSIYHTGDNLTGAGDGDDEQIQIDLSKVTQAGKTIVLTVNSFQGQTFDKVENAFCRILDDKDVEFARYDLSQSGSHTAQIMAKLVREGTGWKMVAIGEAANGRTAADLVRVAAAYA
jgi:tellurium resistance protein TerZ